MKTLLRPLPPFRAGEGAQLPSPRVTGTALLGAMLCIAAGESLIGDLDQATDVAAIAAGSGRLTAGGLLLLGSAALLALALAGLGPVVRGSVTGRIGWGLLVAAVPCGGAFAMFHLTLIETGAAGLDPAAMEEFIVERFQGPGVWGLPVAFFVFFGLLSLLLVLIALVRRGVATAWAPALFAAGMLMEAFLGDGVTEIASQLGDGAGRRRRGVRALAGGEDLTDARRGRALKAAQAPPAGPSRTPRPHRR